MPTLLTRDGNGQRLIGLRGKGLFGMSVKDGRLFWGSVVLSESFDVHRDRVFAWARTADIRTARLVCLDEATGETLYERPTATRPFIWPAAAFGERYVAYASQGGFLGLFSIADGALVWSREHKRRIADAPLIARDRLFIAAEDGQLLV